MISTFDGCSWLVGMIMWWNIAIYQRAAFSLSLNTRGAEHVVRCQSENTKTVSPWTVVPEQQFRTYFAYCVYFQRKPLPASSETICGYAQFLSRAILPSSVKNYLSGVKTLHFLLGHEYQFSDDFHLQLLLRGISRLNPHVPRRAKPVTPDILKKIYQRMDRDSSLQCATWACSLTLFYTMSRLGSVLPASCKAVYTHSFLTRDRVNFCKEGLLVTFLQTKTIQFGRRRLHIPLLKLNSFLCPVEAFTRARSVLPHDDYIPAFVFVEDGEVKWLTKDLFIRSFRSMAADAGLEHPSLFTGHSFRRGGATWAFQAGVPGELIQISGDWASDAYKQYLEFSMSNRISLAALFCKKLPKY